MSSSFDQGSHATALNPKLAVSHELRAIQDDATSFVQMVGITGAIDIATALQTTCVLRDDGQVWCVGNGYHGQLGNGQTSVKKLTPVKVIEPAL